MSLKLSRRCKKTTCYFAAGFRLDLFKLIEPNLKRDLSRVEDLVIEGWTKLVHIKKKNNMKMSVI